jgi:hypothetical protein
MDNAGQASTDCWSPTTTDAIRNPLMFTLSRLAYPVIAIASLVAASAAFADDITPDPTAQALSLKSRAQVQAELYRARADGTIKVWSTSYNPLAVAKSLRSRDEVKAERSWAYDVAFYGEDSGSFALSRQQPARAAPSLFAGLSK